MTRMPKAKSAAIASLGVDIGKNTFHLIGLDKRGAIVLRERLSRAQVEVRLANMTLCLVGMEACVGGHRLGRRVQALGHDVRLMAAKYVRPFCRKQKNDFNDAQAIAEAVITANRQTRGAEDARATRPAGAAPRTRALDVATHRRHQPDPRLPARARHCHPPGLAGVVCRAAACAEHDREADTAHGAHHRGPRRRLAPLR